jgi:eukaryotic-like serine/threonine-protein kinase
MLTPGHRLDRYELLCPIASGGMATVWLARMRGKRGFEKLVAIKTIKTELITDQSYSEMFLDEARIASRIHHPNVAQILDLGEEGETLYLVMEYVDGDSLSKMCRLAAKKKKPFPLVLALRVMADACAGLHSAHELKDENGQLLGVVHRDVSPQNILVTNQGAAKVIDFGLAKANAAEQRDAPDTQQGVVKGKIRYLAPEYVTGKGNDRRADIWAVGICLYELVLGVPPFDNLGDLDVVRHLMGPNPSPSLDDPRITPALKPILAKALAKDPDDRFPTALAMRRAIEVAITAIEGETATTEDVAEFIAQVLPELSERRKRTVNKVMEVVMARSTDSLLPGGSQPPPAANVDIVMPAFPPPAPVPESSGEVVELTRKKASSRPPPPMGRASSKDEDARSTPATSLTEQLGERPKSRVAVLFIGVTLALGAFGYFVWPGRDTLLGTGSTTTATSAAPPAEPPPSATTPPTPPPSASAIDMDPAPASASAPVASASAPPVASTPTAVGVATKPIGTGVANPNPSPSTAAATADGGKAKWNFRPEGWGQEPSDPVAAALAAASAERMLKAPPTATPAPPKPPPADPAPQP